MGEKKKEEKMGMSTITQQSNHQRKERKTSVVIVVVVDFTDNLIYTLVICLKWSLPVSILHVLCGDYT